MGVWAWPLRQLSDTAPDELQAAWDCHTAVAARAATDAKAVHLGHPPAVAGGAQVPQGYTAERCSRTNCTDWREGPAGWLRTHGGHSDIGAADVKDRRLVPKTSLERSIFTGDKVTRNCYRCGGNFDSQHCDNIHACRFTSRFAGRASSPEGKSRRLLMGRLRLDHDCSGTSSQQNGLEPEPQGTCENLAMLRHAEEIWHELARAVDGSL